MNGTAGALRRKAFAPSFLWGEIMSEEIFDVVNERDEVIGRAPRSEVHARGLLHRATHVLVFNSRGRSSCRSAR